MKKHYICLAFVITLVMTLNLTLMSGAFKNTGDFYIFESAKNLITHYLNVKKYNVISRINSSKKLVREINKTDALIICGGPGYNRDFFPLIYPLFKYIDEINTPIVPFGLGWSGKPRYLPLSFRFTKDSLEKIKKIHRKIPVSSSRDFITKYILKQNKINNVLNTGCPTLIQPQFKSKTFSGKKIDKICISMAQSKIFHNQNIKLMREIAHSYPSFEKYACFHRGISTDFFTSPKEAYNLSILVKESIKLGFKPVDLSYGHNKMEIYDDRCIHVGYRVHAHAYCISHKIPSFLIWEDGRGQGMSLNLKLRGFPAKNPSIVDRADIPQIIKDYYQKILNKIVFISSVQSNSKLIINILKEVENEINSNFQSFDHINERLEQLEARMKLFFKIYSKFL